jgi:hypothetical protein
MPETITSIVAGERLQNVSNGYGGSVKQVGNGIYVSILERRL